MKFGVERGLIRSILEIRRRLSPASLRRRAWEEGLLGGDRRWLAVGAVAWTLTLAARAWRREPEVVFRTKLKPGETLMVSTERPVGRREGKRASES